MIGKLSRPVTPAFVEAPTPAPDDMGLKLKPTGSRVLLDNVFESGPISEILKIILLLLLFWWKFHKGPLEGGRRTKIVKWDSTGMHNLCKLYHLFHNYSFKTYSNIYFYHFYHLFFSLSFILSRYKFLQHYWWSMMASYFVINCFP